VIDIQSNTENYHFVSKSLEEAPWSIICIQNTAHFKVFVVVRETRENQQS